MSPVPAPDIDPADALLSLYDRAVPQVFGYLRSRCGSVMVAEDLTSETFLAAVDAVNRHAVADVTIGWLIGVARHKLADHWRGAAREERKELRLASVGGVGDTVDDWDRQLDAVRAHEVLAELAPHHRAALTFRYLDGLSVPEVASCLDRTLHATEALLVRARRAFRARYDPDPEWDDPSAPSRDDQERRSHG